MAVRLRLVRSNMRFWCAMALLSQCVSLAHGAEQSKSASGAAPIRGIVRALHQASIGTEFPARIAKLHFREAEAFKKGDRLVTFDCKRIEADHAAATATSREMRLTFESHSYLDKRGAVGKLEVEISRARLERAEAESAAIAARLEQCVITAPFAGRITELKVNEHEMPPTGQPFIGLVNEAAFEIDLIFPSHVLRTLKPGTPFTFQIDETGRTYRAEVLRLGAAVDPVSQSVKVIAGFVDPDARVLAGMSGSADVQGLETAAP